MAPRNLPSYALVAVEAGYVAVITGGGEGRGENDDPPIPYGEEHKDSLPGLLP